MSDMQCPGRTSAVAYLSSMLVPCPDCGKEVEIFGDEIKVRCRCGSYVFREALPACSQWCSEAERCFGQVGAFPKSVKGAAGSEELQKQEEQFRKLQAFVFERLNTCSKPKEPIE